MNATAAAAERAAAVLQDPRWAAVAARDPEADGRFYYSVDTTGVYCRPSCGARRPRPEHVRFHDSCDEAERAGFRPCKRCKPRSASGRSEAAARIAAACRLIEQSETMPDLAGLAAQAQLSPAHFHRVFKARTGLTPREYARAHRAARVRDALAGGAPVTDAIYAAGYGSQGRFYEAAPSVLGMKPRDYRSGGEHARIRFAIGECSLGSILVAQSEQGICAILLGDDPEEVLRDFQRRFARAELIGGDADFEQLVARVVAFVEAPQIGLDLPLDVRGTAFQQRVWQALRAIPPGMTVTYAELARRIGAPRAVRAVGAACGANPIAVAIPCHRVVRSDGDLSGYRWGIARKRTLLDIEAAAAEGGGRRRAETACISAFRLTYCRVCFVRLLP